MNFFGTHSFDYLISTSDDINRAHIRVPAVLPVHFTFLQLQKKDQQIFHGQTVDVSSSGIALEIKEYSEDLLKKILKKHKKILLNIPVGKENLDIGFSGEIKWHKMLTFKGHQRLLIGINYDQFDYTNKIINFFYYALKLNRRKKIIQIIFISLAVLLCMTGAWGIKTLITKKTVEQNLAVSETARQQLQGEIKDMIIIKGKLEKEMTNYNNITQILRENLEQNVFNYIVVPENETIFIELTSDFSAFENENYINANKAIEQKNYNEAIRLYKKYIDKNPDSPLGYSGLSRALYRANREVESRAAIKNYLKLLNKKKQNEIFKKKPN